MLCSRYQGNHRYHVIQPFEASTGVTLSTSTLGLQGEDKTPKYLSCPWDNRSQVRQYGSGGAWSLLFCVDTNKLFRALERAPALTVPSVTIPRVSTPGQHKEACSKMTLQDMSPGLSSSHQSLRTAPLLGLENPGDSSLWGPGGTENRELWTGGASFHTPP